MAVRPRSNVLRWTVTILVGLVVGTLGGYSYSLLRRTNTTPWQLVQPPFGGRRFIRILVLGEDNTHKSVKTGRGLSDTIMVAAVDLVGKRVRAVSVPRDTRVEISGYGDQKINAAYSLGGPELATEAARAVLGIDGIDYYIKTDIAGLKNIVDLVDGVGIEVEKNMYYRDRRGGLYINLKKGYRHLDGDKALQYVRFRHDTMGDITRTQRQQKFLRALARHMLLPKNWVRLPAIVNEIYDKGYVDTNLNLKDINALAKIARDVPPDEMEMETLPGAPQNGGGISYWVIDPEKTSEIVDRLLDFSGEPIAKVEVLNGSGTYGAARDVAELIERSGYKVTLTGNAPNFGYKNSQIIVHNPDAGGTVELAQLIRCTDVRNESTSGSANGADMTVIVGRDYRP